MTRGAAPAAPRSAATDGVIDLDDVHVMRDDRALLDAVSLRVADGERWTVLGENGSGKTTLLKVVSTYLWPSSGRVHVLGEQLGTVDVREMRKRIGYSSAPLQRMLDVRLRAITAVATGKHAALAQWHEDYDETDWERARKLLHQVGLETHADRPVEVLSEGERQRLHLARSLMNDPELLLLDEPTAGLDIGAREALVRRLADLDLDDRLRAMVLVTHHVEEIPPNFTHVALIRAGRLLATGPLDEVLTSESLSECFGLPLTLTRHARRFAAWHG